MINRKTKLPIPPGQRPSRGFSKLGLMRSREFTDTEKRTLALAGRVDGHTFTQISLDLGCTIQQAINLYRQAIECVPRETVEAIRNLNTLRVDRVLEAQMPNAAKPAHAKVILEAISISTKIYGAQAPTQIDVRRLTDEELAEKAVALGLEVPPELMEPQK
jgi:hypothetical protein